ncbi:unnamed protein product [Coregonus sp. 'balchen']|nr:unnamed protein product [Coregonus sp. 'balchen']
MEFEEMVSSARRLSLSPTEKQKRGSIANADTRMDRKRESHYIGAGPEFQHVLTDVEERSHKRQQEYNTFCQQTKQEIADIHRDRLIHNMKLNRMKKEIFSNRIEVKIASEGIMNKWNHPPYRQCLQKGEGIEMESEEVKNANQPSVSPENRKTAGQ